MSSIVCKLPWPPSVNHAWRPTRTGGKILSDKYRQFKVDVGAAVLEQRIRRHQWTTQKLILGVACRPPSLASFDIDNRLKTLIDALSFAGVIADDKHIDMIIVRRASLDPPHGSVTVRIDELVTPARMSSLFDEWFVGCDPGGEQPPGTLHSRPDETHRAAVTFASMLDGLQDNPHIDWINAGKRPCR